MLFYCVTRCDSSGISSTFASLSNSKRKNTVNPSVTCVSTSLDSQQFPRDASDGVHPSSGCPVCLRCRRVCWPGVKNIHTRSSTKLVCPPPFVLCVGSLLVIGGVIPAAASTPPPASDRQHSHLWFHVVFARDRFSLGLTSHCAGFNL